MVRIRPAYSASVSIAGRKIARGGHSEKVGLSDEDFAALLAWRNPTVPGVEAGRLAFESKQLEVVDDKGKVIPWADHPASAQGPG